MQAGLAGWAALRADADMLVVRGVLGESQSSALSWKENFKKPGVHRDCMTSEDL